VSIAELEQVCARTREIIVNTPVGMYDRPTPCRLWNVRRLINHTIAASHWVAHCVNTGEAPDHDRYEELDYVAGDVPQEYDHAVNKAVETLTMPGAQDKPVRFPFGTLTGEMLLAILVDDQFVHGWDLAKATAQAMTDVDEEMAERLLAHHAGRSLDRFRGPEGEAPYGPQVEVDSNAPATDRLAAFFGRTP
jgi:uncharacterized protein (TIGR03086 family)